MANFSYTIYILLVPLLIFAIVGIWGGKWKPIISGLIGTFGIAFILVLSYYAAYQYFFVVNHVGHYKQIVAMNFLWLPFNKILNVHMGILLDPISAMMLIVVPTISLMSHWYSLGYMKGERGFARYYAFLSLFTFSMLGLVLSTDILQMFIFYELVGVSSYLLIGFYYQRPSAVAAAKKAFIVTRFADFGFLVGILVLVYYTHSFDFMQITDPHSPVFRTILGKAFLGYSVLAWALSLIFVGAAGKSAMFPFHIWLPDAMEGPTPVSALIHAATMVVAGVFTVARIFPIYVHYTPNVLLMIGYVGGFTSLFAALIAMTQFDIKRVLAYSTLSQIGYMMVGLGVSRYGGEEGLGYTAAMFHLFTHAMFKALLFLGAGSIIHAVHSNFMQKMGALRKYMPITHITFLVAALAISGIPPFAGFFSKDKILEAAFMHNRLLFWVEYITAGLTAFYIFRLYFKVFWWTDEPQCDCKPHESPSTMTIPLIILAILSSTVGFIPFNKFVTPDLKAFPVETDWGLVSASVAIGLLGLGFAWFLYRKENDLPDKIVNALGKLYQWTYDKFYIDEIYLFITKKILFNLVARPIAWFDRHIVDGFMVGVAIVTGKTAEKIKGFQSGHLQQYAFVFIASVLIIALTVLYFIGA